MPPLQLVASSNSGGFAPSWYYGGHSDPCELDEGLTMPLRDRPWPAADATLRESVLGFLQAVHTTAVNKLDGLDEQQARATPLPTSPAMSPLGLVKHLTAVQREHVQRRIGGQELPSLWRSDDYDFEFRIGPDETIASVISAYDDEWARSQQTLATADWSAFVPGGDEPVRVERILTDVLQESARHLGHLDILRELIDGARGE
ncbi:DinB family protein [Kribbella sp. ALI-6-A]|uniref:DinB family protein n=1 Tax=Kribbella sp. ALI-6-A TaxID=1933817 RepID=UPI00192D0F49|nr:DinB family protein [Kribbella sp. ALI-6-A]